MTVTTEIGKPRARKEDARLVTGQTNWTDNIVLPGLMHVAYLRSPRAHARMTAVDVPAARAVPRPRFPRGGGQPALPLPGAPGHPPPAPPADGHRRGPLRGRDRGLR